MKRRPRVVVLQVVIGLVVAFVLVAPYAASKANKAKLRSSAAQSAQAIEGVKAEQAKALGALAVARWSGQQAVPVGVYRLAEGWEVVAMSMGLCFSVAVTEDVVSSTPGLVDCPWPRTAPTDGASISKDDPRARTAVGFLEAWLSLDENLDRWLAADTVPASVPFRADKFEPRETYLVYEQPTIILVTAQVTGPAVMDLAWRVTLAQDHGRWSVAQVSGGAFPSVEGARSEIGRGVSPTSTITPIAR